MIQNITKFHLYQDLLRTAERYKDVSIYVVEKRNKLSFYGAPLTFLSLQMFSLAKELAPRDSLAVDEPFWTPDRIEEYLKMAKHCDKKHPDFNFVAIG